MATSYLFGLEKYMKDCVWLKLINIYLKSAREKLFQNINSTKKDKLLNEKISFKSSNQKPKQDIHKDI